MTDRRFPLTPAELALVSNLPEDNLVELAVELDIPVPAEISRADLFAEAIPHIVDRARAEGLPFSKYDRDDLAALSNDELSALASLCGTTASVNDLLKKGQRVYRVYNKQRPGSQVAMMLPMLLTAVVRYAKLGET